MLPKVNSKQEGQLDGKTTRSQCSRGRERHPGRRKSHVCLFYASSVSVIVQRLSVRLFIYFMLRRSSAARQEWFWGARGRRAASGRGPSGANASAGWWNGCRGIKGFLKKMKVFDAKMRASYFRTTAGKKNCWGVIPAVGEEEEEECPSSPYCSSLFPFSLKQRQNNWGFGGTVQMRRGLCLTPIWAAIRAAENHPYFTQVAFSNEQPPTSASSSTPGTASVPSEGRNPLQWWEWPPGKMDVCYSAITCKRKIHTHTEVLF